MRAAAAAVALSLLAASSGCCGCAASGTFERRGGAAGTPGPASTPSPPVVRVLHFGDFGEATCQQAAVARAIADAQRRAPFDLAFHAGDNLYDCGPEWRSPAAERCAFAPDGATVAPGYAPPADPSFQSKFEGAVEPLSAAGVPVYLALGNHDVATWGSCGPVANADAVSRTKACLEIAHSGPAWRFPARHYVVDRGPARFIVLDSNVIARDYAGFTLAGEAAFLAASAGGCDARPCFVVAHHPPAAAGKHAADLGGEYAARVERLVAAAGGNLRGWLSGHDHDLQHVRTAGGLDVFVSGNGARARPGERFEAAAPPGSTLLYGTVRWGYAVLEVSATGFAWRVEDEHGAPRYCCAATLAGAGGWSRCEPIRCG